MSPSDTQFRHMSIDTINVQLFGDEFLVKVYLFQQNDMCNF